MLELKIVGAIYGISFLITWIGTIAILFSAYSKLTKTTRGTESIYKKLFNSNNAQTTVAAIITLFIFAAFPVLNTLSAYQIIINHKSMLEEVVEKGD